mmetsp:Transcript_49238/g.159588  ORF Transcript_49238/g.159588 Transcript_49238/m.159588 type:complete len:303 (+) Transcript_49238:116-1024(+)
MSTRDAEHAKLRPEQELAAMEPILDQHIPKTYDPEPAGLPVALLGFDCSRRGRCCACCAGCIFDVAASCGGSEARTGYISNPEQMFGDMLRLKADEDCPDRFRGVFWQRDSSTVETLISLHEADWQPGGLFASKRQILSWTIVPSCFGYLFWVPRTGALRMTMAVSPSGKWAVFDGNQFMYALQPGDTFTHADGSPADVGHDYMRINFKDNDPTKGVTWQYLVQRVAYLDKEGTVRTTKAYEDLKARATEPSVKQCGHMFACCVDDAAKDRMLRAQSDKQVYCVPRGSAPLQATIAREYRWE